ncbi:hypothetical protein Srut_16230 [Streptomyces rutgersensis]|nr:hypothetical protein Srut_16230 [Streptomyces rutgersensis]
MGVTDGGGAGGWAADEGGRPGTGGTRPAGARGAGAGYAGPLPRPERPGPAPSLTSPLTGPAPARSPAMTGRPSRSWAVSAVSAACSRHAWHKLSYRTYSGLRRCGERACRAPWAPCGT